MNKLYSSVLFSLVFALFFGCVNSSLSVEEDDSNIQETMSEVHISIDLNREKGKVMAKVSALDDGLTIAKRKQILQYQKEMVESFVLIFWDSTTRNQQQFRLFAIDGEANATLLLNPGVYDLFVFSTRNPNAKIDSITNSLFTDFSYEESGIEVSDDDTIKVFLQESKVLPCVLVLNLPDVDTFFYDEGTSYLWLDGPPVMTASDFEMNPPLYTNGKLITNPFFANIVAKDFLINVNRRTFKGHFDISTIHNDTVVVVMESVDRSVSQDIQIRFPDQADFLIENTSPSDGDSLVPIDIDNITAYFNQDYAGLDEMPGAGIVVRDDVGNIINSTTGWTGSAISKNMATPTGGKMYLRPNTSYTACVENIVSKYGKELSGQNCWSFITEEALFFSYDRGNEENYDKSLVGGTSAILSAFKVESLEEGWFLMDLSFFGQRFLEIFESLELIDSDKVTIIAEGNIVSNDTVKFVNFDYRMVKSNTFYLRGTLNKIGKDFVGVNDAQTSFTGVSIYAQNPSQNKNFFSRSTTAPSNKILAVANKISETSLVSSAHGESIASNLLQGWNKAAIVKIVADSDNGNKEMDGDEVNILLNKLGISLDYSENLGTSVSGLRLRRIGPGLSGRTLTREIICPGSCMGEFDMTNSVIENDDIILSENTAYYLVEVLVDSITQDGNPEYVQVKINSLDWQDGEDGAIKQYTPQNLTGEKITEAI